MDINEKIYQAVQEFKGLDHLIHFSLKYTRTTSVLKTVLEKIRNIEEYLISALYIYSKEKDSTLKDENVIVLRSRIVCDYFKDDILTSNHEFYLKVKKLIRCESKCSGDFRKHVGLTFNFEEGDYVFDLKEAMEYYKKTRKIFRYILDKMEVKPFQIDFEDLTI
ncbi:MAG: hypothetical protein PHT94_00065 [Candidatus Nanoarchaeia archaeon]|nr:hypothetical protein [Candidatus Nanoarchaeia archaeon]